MKLSKELVKGSTATLVLSVLKSNDLYGYKIIKEIQLRSENVFDLKEGTLYPILRRLENMKLLTVRSEEYNGRLRKYYRITDSGQQRLAAFSEEWSPLAVTAVFRAGTVQRDVIVEDGELTIPWEVLQKAGCPLYLNFYGAEENGRVVLKRGRLQLEHPEIFSLDDYQALENTLRPVYPLHKGLTEKQMKAIKEKIAVLA